MSISIDHHHQNFVVCAKGKERSPIVVRAMYLIEKDFPVKATSIPGGMLGLAHLTSADFKNMYPHSHFTLINDPSESHENKAAFRRVKDLLSKAGIPFETADNDDVFIYLLRAGFKKEDIPFIDISHT